MRCKQCQENEHLNDGAIKNLKLDSHPGTCTSPQLQVLDTERQKTYFISSYLKLGDKIRVTV